MIKVIWIAVIHWILSLGPKAEAFHGVTGMRAYYESFLQVKIIVMAVSKVFFRVIKKFHLNNLIQHSVKNVAIVRTTRKGQ